MGIAERIYEVVKSLPEVAAKEVLEFAEGRRAMAADREVTARRAALSVVGKRPGKLKVVKEGL